jgi:Flp pilus assembly protein TadG
MHQRLRSLTGRAGRSPTGARTGGTASSAAGGERRRERGTVTAELALALPAVVGVLVALLLLSSAATTQLRAADAARAGARAAALGEETTAVTQVAQRLAGAAAGVQVERDGAWVTVTVRRDVALGPMGAGGLTASARATARVEP